MTQLESDRLAACESIVLKLQARVCRLEAEVAQLKAWKASQKDNTNRETRDEG